MQTRVSKLRLLGPVLLLQLTVPLNGAGQSLTSGSMSGVVRDGSGAALFEADVNAEGKDLGLRRTTRTSRNGTFTLGLLPPGHYDLLIERIGYRPRWIRGVIVKSGEATKVDADLTAAPPPVDRADESQWPERSVGWSAGLGQQVPEFELRTRLGRRQTGTLTELTAFSGAEGEIAGLPGWLSGFAADGIALRGLGHPQLSVDPLGASALALSSVGGMSVLPTLPDVEWPGLAGGLVNTRSRAGTGTLAADVFGAWSGGVLGGSKHFDAAGVSPTSILGAGLIGGPIVQDSMHALVGLEVERLELLHSGLPFASTNSTLAGLARAGVSQRDSWSAFGRFDWRLAPAHTLSVRGNATGLPTSSLLPPFESGAIPDATAQGRDASAGLTLLSEWNPGTASEFRLGAQLSHRDYGDAGANPVPSTVFTADGLRSAVNSAGAGLFDRNAVRVMQTFHFIGTAHRLKLGLSGEFGNYKQTYSYGAPGEFFLGDWRGANAFRGTFVQTAGSTPEVQVSGRTGALYVQDIWSPIAGLELTGGVRLEVARTSLDWVANPEWLAATGVVGNEPKSGFRVNPRGALRWDLQDQHRVVVNAAAGMDHGPTPESPLAEVATHQGLVEIRRGLGGFPDWPAPADQFVAPVQGPRLAYLGPDYRSPRTVRGALGLEVSPRGGTIFQVGFLTRRTEFLSRRHDLNRLSAPVGTDQHGRAIWGELVQFGGVLAATPGSNRRFPEFAEVFALEADGSSDYQGVFVGLRHESRAVGLSAGYTRSRTTDNWLGERSASQDARLNPQLSEDEVDDWSDGISDFDVPDRAFAMARLRLSSPVPVTFSVVYTYRSGYPFTPSVQSGIDANGDGSFWNDPAFIDDDLAGASALLSAWPCLRNQAGRFAERNSCRGEAMQALDARVSVDLVRVGSHTSALTVDVLNLIEPGGAAVDAAFMRIDGGRALIRTPGSASVQVPYVVNPNFGNALSRHTPGRIVYIGLRIHR